MSGVPSWAVHGAKVVCVKSGQWTRTDGIDEGWGGHPVLDSIYTIDTVVPDERGELFISLIECWPFDLYVLDHFRPLVTRTAEQDLAIFAPLLDQVSEPA